MVAEELRNIVGVAGTCSGLCGVPTAACLCVLHYYFFLLFITILLLTGSLPYNATDFVFFSSKAPMTYSEIAWRSLQTEARSAEARTKGICLLWAEYTEALQIVCVTVSHIQNTDIYFVGRISLRRPCSGSEVENTTWRTS